MEVKKGYFCPFHQDSIGHTIQECPDFLGLVQKMMDASEIEFCKKVKGKIVAVTQEKSSGVSNDNRQEEMPRLLTIFYKGGNQPKVASQLLAPKLIVKVLALFPYQNDKVVS